MARYKKYCYDQGKLLSVHFHKLVVEGTFEYTLSYLIDNKVDLTPFDDKFCNDETGAPAHSQPHFTTISDFITKTAMRSCIC